MNGILLLAVMMTNVCGTITFEREGLPFYFLKEDSGANWRIERTSSTPKLAVGTRVKIAGEREPSAVKLRLADVKIENLGAGEPLPPKTAAIGEIFQAIMPFGNCDWYGSLIVTEGLLRDINRRQTSTQLLVGEGERNLQVGIPISLENALPESLVQGATVRVTGALTYTSIENFEEGIFGRIENVELIPMSPGAVEVIRRAPFWTAERLRWLFEIALIVLLAVLIWAITLRRMVAKRTAQLAESIRERETARIEEGAARRERLRLAADLHDGFQQYLAGAMFRLKAAQNYLPADAVQSREQMEKVKDALQHTQNGLRDTLWAMNEESEGPESILELFRFVSHRLPHWEGIVEISSSGEERKIAHNFAGTLLLILQEAVGNAIRHGGAKHVKVTIDFHEKDMLLTVADDGAGFDLKATGESGHYGLSSMERRTADLGGKMELLSAPKKGTTAKFFIPL